MDRGNGTYHTSIRGPVCGVTWSCQPYSRGEIIRYSLDLVSGKIKPGMCMESGFMAVILFHGTLIQYTPIYRDVGNFMLSFFENIFSCILVMSAMQA